ncbi:MAG: CRTAC1 family protein [Planctomycetota bacterium]|nr:CRTAC1 family protein [Planctomycetota bacterium]
MQSLLAALASTLLLQGTSGAQVQFVDVTDAAGLAVPQGAGLQIGFGAGLEQLQMTGGAAAGDFNGDGWVDLFVTMLDRHDVLFANLGVDGNGDHRGFRDVTARCFPAPGPGPRSNGAVFGDIDNDGDEDLYLTSVGSTRYQLWINDGEGHFRERARQRGAAVETTRFHSGQSPALGDFDRDGWLDLYVTEWVLMHPSFPVAPHTRLLRNRGAAAPGHFEDVTAAAGLDLGMETGSSALGNPTGAFQFTPRFSDLDGDGWPDLAIAGDFLTSHLFWNNGDGTFTEGTAAAGVGGDQNGMGATIADYNGDGLLDWFVTSIYDRVNDCTQGSCGWGSTGNRLYLNAGGRGFVDGTDAAGVRDGGWGWGATSLDYDNDGDVDLTMTNGIDWDALSNDDHFIDDPMRLWRNDGATFTEVAQSVGLTATAKGKGYLTLDYDRDGDLDLYVVHHGEVPVLYENVGGDQNDWIQLDLVGSASNRDAVGAFVRLTAAPGVPEQVRETSRGSNFLSSDEDLVHFGLGAPSSQGTVARIEVRWPSGQTTVLTDVARNQRHTVVEP